MNVRFAAASLLVSILTTFPAQAQSALGLFDSHTDIGEVGSAGRVSFDAASGIYTVGGSGENMWFDRDEFHFVWKKVSGDVALAADIEVLSSGANANAHRKAIIMIRQSLDPDSAYADVALHGDQLTSLQFRKEKGGITHEIRTINAGPRRLKLEKRGSYCYMSVGGDEASLEPTGSSVEMTFEEPFYIGIGVCAHDNGAFETARFSNVVLREPSAAAAAIRSAIEIVPIASGDRTCVFASQRFFEAASWTPDGEALMIHGEDQLYRLQLQPRPRLEPIGSGGGAAIRLTNHSGLDGEAVYAHDGASVYFSSDKSGRKQLYRMMPDGSGETQLTFEEGHSRYPYPSPDGRWLAYLSYEDAIEGEPRDVLVALRILDLQNGESRVVAEFLGGAGTLKSPPWSPDSTHLAYVRYQPE